METQPCHSVGLSYSQNSVVPEDTDRLRALLGGHKAELHGDRFVQVVLQQGVVVVDRDADHRSVDDRTLRHPAAEWRTTVNQGRSRGGEGRPRVTSQAQMEGGVLTI